MRLSVTASLDQGFRDLDAFADRIRSRAIPRALNTLRDQAQTAGFRRISDAYQIPARMMEQYATVQAANADDAQAGITVKGKGFSLGAFKPAQTGKGVAVTVKGKRIVIPHSFMVARFGAHVFARGSYGGKYGGTPTGQTFGRYVYTKERLPIAELFTFGPAEAFSNQRTVDAMNGRVDEQAASVLAREIRAVARGF